MKYIKLMNKQNIELYTKEIDKLDEAIQEAIDFAVENETSQCTLYAPGGYAFDIAPDSDIDKMVADYDYWLDCNNNDDESE